MREIKNTKSTIWFLSDSFVDTISIKERTLFILQKLEEIRIKEGITQKALTEKLKIGEKTINHWKSGVQISNRTIGEIIKIYPELEAALIEFYREKQEPLLGMASDNDTMYQKNYRFSYDEKREINSDILLPKITPGQTLFFKQLSNIKVLPWGNIFLVKTPDFEVIRIVNQGPNNTYILTSPNEQYQPIELKESDIKAIFIHQVTITETTL